MKRQDVGHKAQDAGRKANGRKSDTQRQKSPRRNLPVSFVAMAMATWNCSGASSRCYNTKSSRRCNTASLRRCSIPSLRRCSTTSLRRCSTTSSHCYDAVARVAATLRRCCSMCHGSVATLLQHASLRQRCGAALARVVATLQRCCCDAVAARDNDGKQHTMQRWQVALVLATTTSRAALLCSDGRWPAPKFLFFFYSIVSKREREQDKEKRDRGSKPISRLCWLASSFLSTPSFNVNSF